MSKHVTTTGLGAAIAALLLSAGASARGSDWPTYMRDNQRTGRSPVQLQLPLSLAWTYHARRAPQPAWPPPAKQNLWKKQFNLKPRVTFDRAFHVVGARGLVYFGSSADDQVRCLDVATGKLRWKYFASGPIRLAPSISGERLFFGSDDGRVYCVDASAGNEIWSVAAVQPERRIPGNGRMISAWPVRSDILVHEDTLRFTAGLFPSKGTFQIALSANDGKLIAKAPISISPQGYLQRRGERLYLDSGRIRMSYFTKLQRRGLSPPRGKSKNDATSPPPSSIIASGTHRIIGNDGLLRVVDAQSPRVLWQANVEGNVHSLAVIGQSLIASTDRGLIYCFRHAAPKPTDDKPTDDKPADDKPAELRRTWPEAVIKRGRKAADEVTGRASDPRGYALAIGSNGGYLVHELARRTSLQVIGLEQGSQAAAATRQAIDSAGTYGQAVIHRRYGNVLPYGDYLFNVVVVDLASAAADNVTAQEVMRVVRPEGGIAIVLSGPSDDAVARWLGKSAKSWTKSKDGVASYRRGALEGVGQWSHLYGNVGNTVCSEDTHVGNQLAVQWFGRPGPRKLVDRHHRAMSPLYHSGRMFVPGDNYLFAVDAYNGVPLWERAIPNSRRVGIGRDCGNMVAAEDVVYVAAGSRCLRFDVATGKPRSPFEIPAADQPTPDWGFVARHGDRILGSATRGGASRSEINMRSIEDAYKDRRPLVTSNYLFCLNRNDGRKKWDYRPRGAIINPTITIGKGNIYFIECSDSETLAEKSGRLTPAAMLAKPAKLVALDVESGTRQWTRNVSLSHVQHDLYVCTSRGQLVIAGSGNQAVEGEKRKQLRYYLEAFDVQSGMTLWQRQHASPLPSDGFHGEQNKHPVVVGDVIYVEPYAYYLSSGKPVTSWKMKGKRGGCGQMSASRSAFYFRDGTSAMCDLATGKCTSITKVNRPGCWINMIPAGGLLLMPEGSSGCTCGYAIQTSMALIPVRAKTQP